MGANKFWRGSDEGKEVGVADGEGAADGATDDTDNTDDKDATESATDARRGLFVDACESVALAGVAGVEAFFKPVHSLFRGSVCECVWNYIAFALFLKPVVADGIGGIEGRL